MLEVINISKLQLEWDKRKVISVKSLEIRVEMQANNEQSSVFPHLAKDYNIWPNQSVACLNNLN